MSAMMLPSLRLPAAKRSGLAGTQIVAAKPQSRVGASARRLAIRASVQSGPSQEFLQGWLRRDPYVFLAGFLGWTVPSSIPVPAFGGNSLFGAFLGSIGENLSHFPKGPGISDRFWLLLVVYHVGLFVTLTLGQIGWQGRKQGYWG